MRAHDLTGKKVSDSEAMKTVIAARAQVEALRKECAALRKDRDQLLEEFTDARKARKLPAHKPRKVVKGKEDRVRVSFGDVHGMRMDKAAVAALLDDLRILDPDEIVIGGDLVECGGWLARHQPIGFVALSDYTYQEDIEAANWLLDEVAKAAPRAEVFYIEGNHEDRVERWIVDQVMANKRDAEFLYEAFSPRSLLRLEERGIMYFRRTHVYVEGLPRGWMKLGNMHFTHTLGKGKNAARQSATKTGGNVTYFCTHREDTATIVLPAVGMVKAYNPGCLCTMQPVWMNSDVSDWSQGYAIDVVAKSGNFQRLHVPIWRGESLAGAMVERFRK
jgi:hypothetical protein